MYIARALLLYYYYIIILLLILIIDIYLYKKKRESLNEKFIYWGRLFVLYICTPVFLYLPTF